MDFEEEIESILNSIQTKELDTFEEIEERRIYVVEEIFKRFSAYKDNRKNNFANKRKALKELEEYTVVGGDELEKGDFVKYFNLSRFHDLKLTIGGTVIDPKPNYKGYIWVKTILGKKSFKPLIVFKQLDEDTLLKMKLIQIAHSI